jgi:hypothetical protein
MILFIIDCLMLLTVYSVLVLCYLLTLGADLEEQLPT